MKDNTQQAVDLANALSSRLNRSIKVSDLRWTEDVETLEVPTDYGCKLERTGWVNIALSVRFLEEDNQ